MAKRKHPKPVVKRVIPLPIKPKVQVDIIIPVYNGFDMLEKCLSCIPEAARGVTYRITLVDNHSTDSRTETLFREWDRQGITIFIFDANAGFPRACNYGASKGTADFLLFLNTDCYLQPGSIRTMLDNFQDEKVGIVGPKLLFPLDSIDPTRPAGHIQHAGIAITINSNTIHQFIGWSADHPKANVPEEVTAVTGAALMVRRELFLRAGGFHEGYGMGTFEDVDLCFTARSLGYKVWYEPRAWGYHVAGGTQQQNGIYMPLQINHGLFVSRWSKALRWTDVDRW